MNQPGILNARYKGRRLVDPRRMTDEYAVIDEIKTLPPFSVDTSPDANGFAIVKFEPIFDISQFFGDSPLLTALYSNYNQYRCRSATLHIESVFQDNINLRHEIGIYWVPNHAQLDNGHDVPINSWAEFREKNHTSIMSMSAQTRLHTLRYIPQVTEVDQEEEDDPDIPAVELDVRSSQPGGWLPTYGGLAQTFNHRGPQIIFRKPYAAVAAQVSPVFTMSLRVVWEFRAAKTKA